MNIQEFYKDKEKRDLIDTITTAKWVTEEQKEAILDILAEDWESDRAAGAKAAEDPHRLQAKRAEKKRAQTESRAQVGFVVQTPAGRRAWSRPRPAASCR